MSQDWDRISDTKYVLETIDRFVAEVERRGADVIGVARKQGEGNFFEAFDRTLPLEFETVALRIMAEIDAAISEERGRRQRLRTLE